MNAKTSNPETSDLAALIDWWTSAGLDTLVDETPHDWFATAKPVESARPAPAPNDPAPPATPSTPAPTAALPDSLAGFATWLADPATLAQLGPRRCAPAGAAGATLMLMVDMPESEDFDAGRLVAGDAGMLLDAMLAAIGQSRDAVYLSSLAPGRPATGQIDADLARILAPAARHHTALVAPRLLLVMGEASCQALLGTTLVAARGQVHTVDLGAGTGKVGVVASFAPRFLLRHPERKGDAWADLKRLRAALAG